MLWTARVALLAYACALLAPYFFPKSYGPTSSRQGQSDSTLALVLSTLALAALAVHVAVAFDRVHHWSHAAAYEHTAARTAAWLGIRVGGGVWVNYAVLAAWTLDASVGWFCKCRRSHDLQKKCSRLSGPKGPRLSERGGGGAAGWRRGCRLLVAFVQFQAAVVFGTPCARVVGSAVFVAWGLMALRSQRRAVDDQGPRSET